MAKFITLYSHNLDYAEITKRKVYEYAKPVSFENFWLRVGFIQYLRSQLLNEEIIETKYVIAADNLLEGN